jgi:hypothetical protein
VVEWLANRAAITPKASTFRALVDG